MPRVTVTISHIEGPSGLWVALKLPAVKRFRYPFRCKHHKCQGPTAPKPVFIHLHRTPSIRAEIQTTILQELFLPAFEGLYNTSFSNEALDLHETMHPGSPPQPSGHHPRPAISPRAVPSLYRGYHSRYRCGHSAAPRKSRGQGCGPHR